MNDIRNTENSLVPTLEPEALDFIAQAVAMMHDGLDTFGKQPSGNLLDVWVALIVTHKVTAAEIKAGMLHFLDGSKMPTAGEFCRWVKEQREAEAIATRIKEMRLSDEQEREAQEKQHRARFVLQFGTEDPTLDQLRGFTQERLKIRFEELEERVAMPKIRKSYFDLDPQRMAEIEAELNARRNPDA